MKKIIGILLIGMAGLFVAGCSGEAETKITDKNASDPVKQEIEKQKADAEKNRQDGEMPKK